MRVLLDPALNKPQYNVHIVVRCWWRGCAACFLGVCLREDMHSNEKAKENIQCVVDKCTVAACEEREECVPAESHHRKQSNICSRILVSLFKGHTSIAWIQISTEKSLSKQFCPAIQPSSRPVNQTKLEHTVLKDVSPPRRVSLSVTYERVRCGQ